jgi:hypothetical protein
MNRRIFVSGIAGLAGLRGRSPARTPVTLAGWVGLRACLGVFSSHL